MAGTETPATALLAKQKVEHRVHTYTHRGGQAYGPEAAEKLGLPPARVFKTLVGVGAAAWRSSSRRPILPA